MNEEILEEPRSYIKQPQIQTNRKERLSLSSRPPNIMFTPLSNRPRRASCSVDIDAPSFMRLISLLSPTVDYLTIYTSQGGQGKSTVNKSLGYNLHLTVDQFNDVVSQNDGSLRHVNMNIEDFSMSKSRNTPLSMKDLKNEVRMLRNKINGSDLALTFQNMFYSNNKHKRTNMVSPSKLWWLNTCHRLVLWPLIIFSVFVGYFVWVFHTVQTRHNTLSSKLSDAYCFVLQQTQTLLEYKTNIEIYRDSSQCIANASMPFNVNDMLDEQALFRASTNVHTIVFISLSLCLTSITAVFVFMMLLQRHKFLLLVEQFIPRHVVKDVMRGKEIKEHFEDVTILFCDICGFTKLFQVIHTEGIVDMLHILYSKFDDLVEKHQVYKTCIIGDAFMCMAGCPIKEDFGAAAFRMAMLAFDMLEEVNKIRIQDYDGCLNVKIGMNTGPVMGCVIGHSVPHYSPFGDVVNTASRMESHGLPNMIHISKSTARVLSRFKEFTIIKRDPSIDIKGKGIMETYWLMKANDNSV